MPPICAFLAIYKKLPKLRTWARSGFFDSQYLYFVRETPGNPEAMRVRLADRKIEVVTSLKGLRRVSDITLQGAYWMGAAPDDSLLLTRDMGTQEIYALNLKVLLSDLRHR
jgi:hypothetical protein